MSKPFDLEKALQGEPVKLRDGNKAYVIAMVDMPQGLPNYRLVGYGFNGIHKEFLHWRMTGEALVDDISSDDIVGMWEEPRPTVTLTLPCPLKEPRDEMWFISSRFTIIKSAGDGGSKEFLEEGRYFASEYDAQEWLNAMRNSSR
ncbi:Uncharacterised protein [Mannheimia haemolytica]|uniref:pyruvate kinase n=1 Tax=Mannheimia haemolytica TaxID=75985 RepID=UPI000DA327C2|nr:pyruvate kinase [Mannheimia haemolytica]SQE32021.1 Uncharacterised protein [Mannheimia haemolytica]